MNGGVFRGAYFGCIAGKFQDTFDYRRHGFGEWACICVLAGPAPARGLPSENRQKAYIHVQAWLRPSWPQTFPEGNTRPCACNGHQYMPHSAGAVLDVKAGLRPGKALNSSVRGEGSLTGSINGGGSWGGVCPLRGVGCHGRQPPSLYTDVRFLTVPQRAYAGARAGWGEPQPLIVQNKHDFGHLRSLDSRLRGNDGVRGVR